MSRRRSERMIVTRVAGAGAAATSSRAPDDLIVEEPMSIQLDGVLVATTMRTPGNDYELAVGFCLTEGMLAGAAVTGVRYCADGSAAASEFNIVTSKPAGRAPAPTPRLGNVSSSCGWCGSEQLDDLVERLAHCRTPIGSTSICCGRCPRRCAASRVSSPTTGAVHAAAAFDHDGAVVVLREDVGRHNAVDKVIGALLLESRAQSPARGLGLFVSGRASIEMVQKAWAAGFSALVAVSAPTALAVLAARRANLLLAGSSAAT